MTNQQENLAVGNEAAKSIKEAINDALFRYHKLAIKYDSHPLPVRRSVTRKYALERFYCGALLQFHADAPFFSADSIKTLGKTTVFKPRLPGDECCPVARTWYNSLFETERLLAEYVAHGYPDAQLGPIQARMGDAMTALEQAEQWLGEIMTVAEEEENISLFAMNDTWNVLCSNVKDSNIGAETAIVNAQVYASTRTESSFERRQSLAGGKRSWFEIEIPPPKAGQ